MEREERAPCRSGGRPRPTGSSSPRSRSGWASTRPTSATSTTTTCRRASSRTPRRSGGPGATARRASASCSPAPTTCPRSRTSPTATRRRGRRSPAARRGARARRARSSRLRVRAVRRHDLRPLVLKTVLTYLELDGVLRQGTPFYAGYRLGRLGGTLDDVFGRFDESARRLPAPPDRDRQDRPHLDDHRARRGRGGARRGAQPDRRRARVPRAAGPGRAERPTCGSATRCSPARRRRWPRRAIGSSASTAASAETERIQRVLSLVTHDGCQVQALVAYFGETRAEPCGHCSFCVGGTRQAVPQPSPRPPIDSVVERSDSPRCQRRITRRSASRGSSPASSAASGARPRPGEADPRAALRSSRVTASRMCSPGAGRCPRIPLSPRADPGCAAVVRSSRP